MSCKRLGNFRLLSDIVGSFCYGKLTELLASYTTRDYDGSQLAELFPIAMPPVVAPIFARGVSS